MTKIAVTGSTGLIGTALVASLRSDGHEVVRLLRPGSARPAGEPAAPWNPGEAGGGLDPAAMAGVTAVVHLAGAGIGDKRWTTARKAEIRDSRVRGTRALASGLASLPGASRGAAPPATLLCASAIGWYGDSGDREVDESAPSGAGFLAGLVRDWEAAADPARSAGIRTVHLRSGLVLARQGGTLGRLLPVFRLGLGLRLGTGGQYMSWISLADEVAAIRFLLDRPDVAGPVNGTAPRPVTNAEFTAALASGLGRPGVLRIPGLHLPAGLAVPVPALRLALGEMAGELLASARVLPRRLLAAGYTFQHPDIASALACATSPG